MLSPISDDGRTPKLEIHVGISPRPTFFTRIRYLAASLQVFGNELRGSRIVVTVGHDGEPVDLYRSLPWSRRYPIEWRWLDRELFRRYEFFATRLQRFRYGRYGAPLVLFLDPDVLVVDDFADIVRAVARSRVLAGVVAHVSPIEDGLTWEALFETAGLGSVPYSCQHTGWGLMDEDRSRRYCPPYLNLGVLLAPREHVCRLGDSLFHELDLIWRLTDGPYRAQRALTLATIRHDVPWDTFAMRYNFPNDDRFVDHYPEEFDDLRLVHFLRTDEIDRDRDFRSPEDVAAMLERPHTGRANTAFVRRLRHIHRAVCSDS